MGAPPSTSASRRSRPKRVRSTIMFRIGRRASWLAFHLLWRITYAHASRVPRRGPVLIVSNHQSHLDPPAVGAGLMFRPTAFVARDTLFSNPVFGWVLRAVNAIPIKRDEADTGAIREVLERLESGGAVVMFPEGTRSPDGCIHPFKRGMALLLKRAKCPIVPVGLDGFADTWPRSAARPHVRGNRLAVVYGEPFDPEDLLRDGPDAALVRVAKAIDALRLEARAILWQKTNGEFPPTGPADARLDAAWFERKSAPTTIKAAGPAPEPNPSRQETPTA